MKRITKFEDFINVGVVEKKWCEKYNFVFDQEENEWDREDLHLCLYEIRKMDMYEPRWTLTKFDDEHEDGEYILFEGNQNEMEEFIGKYIREMKIKNILDEI